MKIVKNIKWAFEKWQQDRVIFIDCRFNLQDPIAGKNEYVKEHLPGAEYMDLEKDLSGPIKQEGGRHPLPDIEAFVAKLENIGITDETTVIAYDNQNHAMASRFWWLMNVIGHQQTYVLDGGINAWKAAGYPLTEQLPIRDKGKLHATYNHHLLATQVDVKKAVDNKSITLIDSRNYERFAGWNEPIDKKAGHIPSAQNWVWTDLFEQNKWKTEKRLQDYFGKLNDQEVIVYCGSGVTATPNVIGLIEAGNLNVKLYVGSWSDWITNENNEIRTIEKK